MKVIFLNYEHIETLQLANTI